MTTQRDYILTEIFDPKRRPRVQSSRRLLNPWEAAALRYFRNKSSAEIIELLTTLENKSVDQLLAYIAKMLPETSHKGVAEELRAKADERIQEITAEISTRKNTYEHDPK